MNFAIIFDMDGVIVISNPYHKKAWKQFFKHHGFSLSDEELRLNVYGKINSEIITHYFGAISPQKIQEYSSEKEILYRQFITKEIVSPKGLLPFLELLKKNKIPCAVATSAPPENVDLILDTLKIRQYFSVVLDDTSVTKGKPDPEIYLKAAQLLHYSPDTCIVIEDSISGLQSGLNACMHVIGIITSHSRQELSKSHMVIDNFSELTLSKLVDLISK